MSIQSWPIYSTPCQHLHHLHIDFIGYTYILTYQRQYTQRCYLFIANQSCHLKVNVSCQDKALYMVKHNPCISRIWNRSHTDLESQTNGYKTALLPLLNRTAEICNQENTNPSEGKHRSTARKTPIRIWNAIIRMRNALLI